MPPASPLDLQDRPPHQVTDQPTHTHSDAQTHSDLLSASRYGKYYCYGNLIRAVVLQNKEIPIYFNLGLGNFALTTSIVEIWKMQQIRRLYNVHSVKAGMWISAWDSWPFVSFKG